MASEGAIEIDLPSTPFSSADSISDLTIHRIKIHQMKVKELLDVCREYNLKASSNRKSDLKKAIISFSENRSLWCTKEHTLSRRRPHKGPHVLCKAKIDNVSKVLPKPHQDHGNSLTSLSSTPGDLATWASAFVSKLEAATETPASGQPPPRLPAFLPETLTRLFMQSLNQLSNTQDVLGPLHSEINSNSAPTDHVPMPSRQVIQVPRPTPNTELPPLNTNRAITQTQSVFYIHLFKNTLEYTDSREDFVDPPLSAQVLSDLNRLAEMWDDSSPRWKNKSLVVVRDKPIAFQYLHEYYRNFKSGRRLWDGLKHNWHTWKILAEEYSSLSENEFWDKWTRNKHRLPLTEIIHALRQAKSDEEAKDAQAAREMYQGKQFEHYFSYIRVKDRIPTIMTKDCAIAKRYRLLKKNL